MEKIQVVIKFEKGAPDDGIVAKEINPYRDEMDRKERLGHRLPFGLVDAFRSKEAGLRTFEVGECGMECSCDRYNVEPSITCKTPETIHDAVILPNGKIRIL